MADLQELFARLNSRGAPPSGASTNGGNQSNNHQATVSSPITSPSPYGPTPHHPSAVMSPNISAGSTPMPEHGNALQQTQQQQQSAQLLSLLRFNSTRSASQPAQQNQPLQLRAASMSGRQAADLVAGFTGKASPPAPQAASTTSMPASRSNQALVPSENPQELLLRLLNQPKPPQPETTRAASTFASSSAEHMPEMAIDDAAQDVTDATLETVSSDPRAAASNNSPMRVFGSAGEAQTTPFEPDAPSKPVFTYINPFDKLEAASPRNRTPAPRVPHTPAPKVDILKPKHGLDGSSSGSTDGKDQHPHKSRKLSPGPSGHPQETVAEAVAKIGTKVEQQLEEALAQAENQPQDQPTEEAGRPSSDVVQEAGRTSASGTADITNDVEGADKPQRIRDELKEESAEAVKGPPPPATDVADNWESAEAEDSPAKDDDQTVTIYKLPMQPWLSITVQNMPQRRATFRPDLFMDIARLKKEFDQIDRSLVSATKNFIVYALVKKGGFRIIRQENGLYRQVFEHHHERIFNIAICTAGQDPTNTLESILGIGVNGSVFWTSLEPTREDQFSDNLDTRGIVLPPSSTQDDNTSGGQLKTRAKPSSRHPEFFAVGRGKSIHIVWPKVAAEYVRGGKGICQTEKYLKERSLKILTGKAGKDFAFSEDDTVIVSLDKAGRMRFWDIRPLTDPQLGIPGNPARQVEVSDTLLEFYTTSPTTKSWPTSVFFFDKDKPFNRGIALRYVMVGMKQNHSFQLWDLGLGKAVQEINLPHEKESDAICSVSFHPRTGIMAVAHPTRNSIFFIHVSCPRYVFPAMNQAVYIERLASKSLAQPPATAIMTTIAEYSFAPKGQIRSLHMLNEPAGPPDLDDPDSSALFELYIMHSKGVCALRIRLSDLGWKKEGEPLHTKDAQTEGIIASLPLKAASSAPDDSSNGGETSATKSIPDRSVRETVKRESSIVSRQSMTPEAAIRASTLAKVESKQDAARAAIINGSEKSEKKKKKRATAETASQAGTAPRTAPSSYAQAAQSTPSAKSPALPEPTNALPTPPQPTDTEAPEWMKKFVAQHLEQSAANAPASDVDMKRIGEIVQTELKKEISMELDILYKRLDDDRRAANAASNAKQEAILRLVSSTLTENVEGVIRKMVQENMREILLPSMLETTSTALRNGISNNLKTALAATLAKELPASVGKALQSPQISQILSETVVKQVAVSIEPIIVGSTRAVVRSATSAFADAIEQKIGGQIRQAHVQREADAHKMSQLTDSVKLLTETIQSMAVAQAELQGQLGNLQQHLSQLPQTGADSAPDEVPQTPTIPQQTPEQLEAEAINQLIAEGRYQEATMKWLQAPSPTEMFDTVIMKCNPAYLSHVSPLLNLSAGTVVSENLDRNTMDRLVWLDAVLKNLDPYVSFSAPL
jgi:hypothetical protein